MDSLKLITWSKFKRKLVHVDADKFYQACEKKNINICIKNTNSSHLYFKNTNVREVFCDDKLITEHNTNDLLW